MLPQKVSANNNNSDTLENSESISPFQISTKTLASMDKAVENFKQGIVSEDTDLSDFLD